MNVCRPRTGDGVDARVFLSYELRRPLLSSDTEGSRTLRMLLGKSKSSIEAIDKYACVHLVRDIVNELSYLLLLPEVADTLRLRLGQVTGGRST